MIKASQARNAARKAREEARKGKGQKVEKILSGKSDVFTLDNAISLVNLAFVSCRINKQQANKIKLIIKKIKNT